MRARVALGRLFSVKPFDKQDVFAADGFDSAFGHVDSALPGEADHCVFNTGIVPAVIQPVEFGQPKPMVILHDYLRTGAAHRCAQQQQFLNLRRGWVRGNFVLNQGVGEILQFGAVDGLVELSLRGGGHIAEPEAKRSCSVIGRFQKVVHLSQIGLSCVLFDDTASPIIGTGVTQWAEDSFQMHGAVGFVGQLQFHRVDWHCFGILKVALPVDKASE
jgi:hypothetical protein